MQYHSAPGGRKPSGQCNYCRKPGHTIDKCYKLQRLRGQNDKGKRLAALVHHMNSGIPLSDLGEKHPSVQQ